MSAERTEHSIFVGPDGEVEFIYSDDLAGLFEDDGDALVARASDCEPAEGGGWTADLRRVGGPVLGPFTRRVDALAAEVDWLEAEMGRRRLGVAR